MHLASSTAQARSLLEAGIMSYFKTIADMRSDYVEWLTRRGDELPVPAENRCRRFGEFRCYHLRAPCGDCGFRNLPCRRLALLTADTGATHLLAWFNIGNVPHQLVQESMQQFAAEVMPHL